MKPLILLDIDGVLNPVAHARRGEDRPELRLSDATVSLVRRLARCGRIAWVSTWPADMTAGLERQLQLEVEPLRVTLTLRPDDGDEPTPKLRSVIRWLSRMEDLGEGDGTLSRPSVASKSPDIIGAQRFSQDTLFRGLPNRQEPQMSSEIHVLLPAALIKVFPVAGFLSATILVLNAAKGSGIIPTTPFTQLAAPVAQLAAIGLVIGSIS